MPDFFSSTLNSRPIPSHRWCLMWFCLKKCLQQDWHPKNSAGRICPKKNTWDFWDERSADGIVPNLCYRIGIQKTVPLGNWPKKSTGIFGINLHRTELCQICVTGLVSGKPSPWGKKLTENANQDFRDKQSSGKNLPTLIRLQTFGTKSGLGWDHFSFPVSLFMGPASSLMFFQNSTG